MIKYNKLMSLALILALSGAVSGLIGILNPRTALGQILLFLVGPGLMAIAFILIIFVKIANKKQNDDEKKKW